MERTNKEFASALRNLADLIDANDNLPQIGDREIYFFPSDKAELLNLIRAFGGTWDKSLGYGGDNIRLTSRTLPVELQISRDKVCRKIVTYDCEPMFSPDDEKEVDAALLGEEVEERVNGKRTVLES